MDLTLLMWRLSYAIICFHTTLGLLLFFLCPGFHILNHRVIFKAVLTRLAVKLQCPQA